MSDDGLTATIDAAAHTAYAIGERVDFTHDLFVRALRPHIERAYKLGAESESLSRAPSSGEAATERALAIKLRKAYSDGAMIQFNNPTFNAGDIGRCAARTYPLPKITRPLRVTLSDGSVWSYEPRPVHDLYPFYCHTTSVRSDQLTINAFLRTTDDYRLLARILSGETETVSEDTP